LLPPARTAAPGLLLSPSPSLRFFAQTAAGAWRPLLSLAPPGGGGGLLCAAHGARLPAQWQRFRQRSWAAERPARRSLGSRRRPLPHSTGAVPRRHQSMTPRRMLADRRSEANGRRQQQQRRANTRRC
jgi:hypothetical protein